MHALILLAFLSQAASPAGEDTHRAIEQAVARGSVERLRQIRSELSGEKAATGSTLAGDCYLLAYTDWRIGQGLTRESRKERNRILKEAQGLLDQCIEKNPSDFEAHALRGTVIGERISGFFKGMFLGPKASRALNRAHQLAPDSPRVALQRGVGFFFTPRMFGGGLKRAEQELRRAWGLFEQENDDRAWPSWGRIDTLGWLGQVVAKQGRVDEAQALYQQALSIDPDHAWIRDELLPALQR